MQRRQCPGMRRMASHPNLPYCKFKKKHKKPMYGLSVFSNVFIDFHYVFTETKTSKTCSSSLESLFIFTFSNSNIFLYYTTSISRFLYNFVLLPCETNWLLATSRLESLYLLWLAYLGLGLQYVGCSSGSLQSSI